MSTMFSPEFRSSLKAAIRRAQYLDHEDEESAEFPRAIAQPRRREPLWSRRFKGEGQHGLVSRAFFAMTTPIVFLSSWWSGVAFRATHEKLGGESRTCRNGHKVEAGTWCARCERL